MRRFRVNPSDWTSDTITLREAEAHHLLHVLRARVGDAVSVIDGQGREAVAVVAETRPDATVILHVCRQGPPAERPAIPITLLQALPKGARMDWIVEKATELGAARIVPVLTDRCVARPDEDRAERRHERWQRIAAESAKQCGTSWIPSVAPLCTLDQALGERPEGGLLIVGALTPGTRHLRSVLDAVAAQPVSGVALLVGPEGDLTEAELRLSIDRGAVPVSFGPRVLRSETAAIFGLSVLAYALGPA